jgi:hypothetical protein
MSPRTLLTTFLGVAAILCVALSLTVTPPAGAASTGTRRCYPKHLAVRGSGTGVSVAISMKTGGGAWSKQSRTNPYPGQWKTWTRYSERVGLTYWEVDSWGGTSTGTGFCY